MLTHKYFDQLSAAKEQGITFIYKTIERWLAKKSTKIIAISEIQKEELWKQHKICKKDKLAVIPLGFDLDRFQENTEEKRTSFRAKYKVENDEIAIGIIGRLVPIKNHQLFINAINKIKNKTSKKIKRTTT